MGFSRGTGIPDAAASAQVKPQWPMIAYQSPAARRMIRLLATCVLLQTGEIDYA